MTDRLPVARSPWLQTPHGLPGAEVRFRSGDGDLLRTEHRRECAFNWPRSLALSGSLAWIEVHTVIRATEPGVYTVGVSGLGRYRLTVGGTRSSTAGSSCRPGPTRSWR